MKWAPGATSGVIVAGGNIRSSANNSLDNPIGIFVAPNPVAIWVADSGNNRIAKWSLPSGTVTIYGNGRGSGASQFYLPYGVYVDTTASNTMYVADTGNHRVQKWLPGANSGITVAGQTGVSGNGLNQLNGPLAVVVDTNGYMYISDTNNYRIMRWAPGSNYGLPIAGNVLIQGVWLSRWSSYIHGLNFDSSGALYIADYDNNGILKHAVSCRKYASVTLIALFSWFFLVEATATSTSTTTTTPFSGTST